MGVTYYFKRILSRRGSVLKFLLENEDEDEDILFVSSAIHNSNNRYWLCSIGRLRIGPIGEALLHGRRGDNYTIY
jgi:hypothetical protein